CGRGDDRDEQSSAKADGHGLRERTPIQSQRNAANSSGDDRGASTLAWNAPRLRGVVAGERRQSLPPRRSLGSRARAARGTTSFKAPCEREKRTTFTSTSPAARATARTVSSERSRQPLG